MKAKIIISLGMFLLTIAYCWLIWIGFGFYSIILSTDMGGSLPLMTRLTAFHSLPFPYHALPWQILAVLSLLINMLWASKLEQRIDEEHMFALPVACHVGWIVFSICCHGIGMLSAYVSYASVLGS